MTAALLAGDLGTAMEILDQVCAAGADLKRFVADLLYYVRGLIVSRVVKNPEQLLDGSDREVAELAELAGKYSPETLYRLLDRLMRGAGELQHAVQPRLVLEMLLARSVQSVQVVPVAELIGRVDRLLASSGGRVEVGAAVCAPAGEPGPVEPSVAAAQEEKKTGPARVAPEVSVPPAPPEPPPAASAGESGEVAVPVAEPRAAYLPQGPVAAQACRKDPQRDWDEFVDYVKARKSWMAPILRMCGRVRLQDGELFLKYENLSDGMILQEPEHNRLLTELAQDFFQCTLVVRIKKRGGGEVDPAEAAGPQEERRLLGQDPLVQLATEVFGGQVVGVRTGPLSRVEKGGAGEL